MTGAALALHPLGLIRAPHQNPDRTPIQPCFAGAARGEVLLDSAYGEGLEGLVEAAWRIGRRRSEAAPGTYLVPTGTYVRTNRLPCLPLD